MQLICSERKAKFFGKSEKRAGHDFADLSAKPNHLQAKTAANRNRQAYPTDLSFTAVLDVDFGVEADRFAVAARHRDKAGIGILERLEHRFRRAPERQMALQRAIVMGRHEYVGFVEPDMLQRLLLGRNVQNVRGQ